MAHPRMIARSWRSRTSLAVGVAALVLVSGVAHAEGSRTVHPYGYFSTEGGGPAGTNDYASLYSSSGSYLNGLVKQQTFLYVLAKPGEQILVSKGSGSGTLYGPPVAQKLSTSSGFDPATDAVNLGFGAPGQESTAGLTTLGTVSGNVINSRARELAGPGSGGDRYSPGLTYTVPSTVSAQGAVYAVVFTGTVQRWDVTVRSPLGDTGCTTGDACIVANADLNGRVFTYAFAGTSDSATNRLFSTLYYITNDGYRYAQTMRGLAPFNYVLYSNDKGFTDKELIAGTSPAEYREHPLYKSVRGRTHTLDALRYGATTGADVPASTLGAQGARYPIFFGNVTASEALIGNAQNRVADTLHALGIPLAPPEPVIFTAPTTEFPDAVEPSFAYPPTGDSTAYLGQGGVFTFWAKDVTSYRIFIRGAVDPVDRNNIDHPDNRLLEGAAVLGKNEVVWDGLNKGGAPIPVGEAYNFEVTGRNGEVHFPFLDAEGNLGGGPTVTRLNGPGAPDSRVYYDDRGYESPYSKLIVGTVGGNICGNSAQQPSPNNAIYGVDSATAYRSWGSSMSGNSGADCDSPSTKFFGDAKGLDLWAYINSSPLGSELTFDVVAVVDVTAEVSAPASVAPGAQVTGQVRFRNLGSNMAEGTTYSLSLPKGTAGVACVGATCVFDAASSTATHDIYRVTGLPGSLSGFGATGVINVTYTAPLAGGEVQLGARVATTSDEPALHAPNSAVAQTAVSGDAPLVPDVTAAVSPPAVAAPGSIVNVPISFTNIGTTSATGLIYTLQLPTGLTGVACQAPASCSYNSVTGLVSVSGLPETLAAGASTGAVLSYTAPSDPGRVIVRATVNAENDANPSNNEDAGETSIWTGAAVTTADVTVTIAPPATAPRGLPVAVPVIFRNTGPADADTSAADSFSVTIPAGLSGVSCHPVPCVVSGSTITWDGPNAMTNGQTFEAGFTYTAPSAGFATGVEVEAVVKTSTAESNTSNNRAKATTTFVVPDMAVEVRVPPGPFLPGSPVSGEVVCTNSGQAPAINALCEVEPPLGAANWALSCTPSSSLASLPPGGQINCAFSFDAPADGQTTTVVGTTGADNEPDDKLDNNEDRATIQSGVPDVFSTITVPASANPGDQVTALLTFGNRGLMLAEGVTYTVNGLPPGLGAVSCGGATCAYDSVAGTVTVTGLPVALAGGQQHQVELSWTVPSTPESQTLTLVSTITTTTQGNPEENDTAEATISVPAAPGQQGEVASTVWLPPSAGPGETVTGTVSYVNIGSVPSDGTSYKIEVSGAVGIPVVSYQGVVCAVAGDGSLSGCGLPATLQPGESLELSVSYEVPATPGSAVTVTTTIGASNDTDPTNNTATAATAVVTPPVPGNPDVTATVAPPSTSLPGALVTVPVSFTNVGPVGAEGVTYVVTLPPGLAGVECVPGCSYDPASGIVTAPPGLPATLAPGEGSSFELRYIAPPSGTVIVTARVDADNEREQDRLNNSATAQTRILTPGVLDLLKTVYLGHDGGAQCATNTAKLLTVVERNPQPQSVTWCFRVTNTGTNHLGQPIWDDPQLAGHIPVLVQGSLPLSAGATAVWYVEAVHERSVVNTVSLEMGVTDTEGTPIVGVPPATGSDITETIFGMIYVPPLGIKLGTQEGHGVVRWTMVWVNDNVVRADGVEIIDVVQAPMSLQTGPTCQAHGATVYSVCEYDPASKRIRVVASFGPDFGVTPTGLRDAPNRLEIDFTVTVPVSDFAQTLKNQGSVSWIPPGGDSGSPLTRETSHVDEHGNPTPGPTPIVVRPPGSVTGIPVDNPVALLLLALAMAGLAARSRRHIRRSA